MSRGDDTPRHLLLGLLAHQTGLIDQAMTALQQALAMGFRDSARLRAETDMEPIRCRPDFQALLDDVTFPRDPFAP